MKNINDHESLASVNGGFVWVKKAITTINSARKLAKASGDSSVSVIINSASAISACGGSENVDSVNKNGFECK